MNKNIKYVKTLKCHGPSKIPQEGIFTASTNIEDISGLSSGIGGCAPNQGACKLTINVKKGIIKEALIETIGCSAMTQSAAMAGEILTGKTILEALNTDLVCDAINDAMLKVFNQLVYGRSQSAFSKGGLHVGSCFDDIGKHKTSDVGTIYSCQEKGPRYLNTSEGQIISMALDTNDEVIGYKYIVPSILIESLKHNNAKDALNEATKIYGRYSEGVNFIDPRKE